MKILHDLLIWITTTGNTADGCRWLYYSATCFFFFFLNTTVNLNYMILTWPNNFRSTTTEVGQDHRSDHAFFLKNTRINLYYMIFTWPNNLEEQPPRRLGKTTGQITAFFLKNTTNNLYYMKIYMTKQFGRTTTEVGQDHRSDHCLFS